MAGPLELQQHGRRFRAFTRLASIGAAAFGLLTLVGWACGVEVLKTWQFEGGVAMNPSTALAFAVAGGALWLARPERASGPSRRAGALGGAAVALVGLIRMAGYGLDRDVGIDRMLFADAIGENRMAPNTAGMFVLVGMGLLLLEVRPGGRR